MSFGYERLLQSGEKNGRKKTNNKWFETQDSIGYWEDFSKQKIIWKRIGSILRFSYDNTGIFSLDSTCFATGLYIKYLVAFLNSRLGRYLMKDSPQTGTGDLLISVQAIEPLLIPLPDSVLNEKIEILIDKIIMANNNNLSIENYENQIENIIYELYNFTSEEIEFIGFQ